jgi:hypothetical protein
LNAVRVFKQFASGTRFVSTRFPQQFFKGPSENRLKRQSFSNCSTVVSNRLADLWEEFFLTKSGIAIANKNSEKWQF